MKNKITLTITLLLPLACFAADDFKPLDVKAGLWETSVTSQVSGVPPIPAEVLARLTPDQRAKMEMAQKTVAARGPQTTVHKSCVTSDELNKPFALNDDSHAGCKNTVISSSATKQEVHFECARGSVQSTGDTHVEAVSPESIKGTSQASSGDGTRTMSFKASFTSRWLGADCGDLKKK